MNFENNRFPKRPLELLSVEEMDELSNPNIIDPSQDVEYDDVLPILDLSSSQNNKAKKIRAGQLVSEMAGDTFADKTFSNINDYPAARDNLGLGSAATEDTSAFDPAGSASTAESNANNYTDSQVDTRLEKSANLSDVDSASDSRDNLGLGSAAVQDDNRYAHRSNNLSDLGSAAIARENLGLAWNGEASPGLIVGSDSVGNESLLPGATVSDALDKARGLDLIATLTLDQDYDGFIALSDIPQDYEHILLTFAFRVSGTSTGYIRVRLNTQYTADTNREDTSMFFDGTNVSTNTVSGPSTIVMGTPTDDSDDAGNFVVGETMFYNYATPPLAGHYFIRSGNLNRGLIQVGKNTAQVDPLTRIVLWLGGTSIVSSRNTIAAGSSVSLWGIRGNPLVAGMWGGL